MKKSKDHAQLSFFDSPMKFKKRAPKKIPQMTSFPAFTPRKFTGDPVMIIIWRDNEIRAHHGCGDMSQGQEVAGRETRNRPGTECLILPIMEYYERYKTGEFDLGTIGHRDS